VSENLDLVRSIVAAHARGDYSSSEWAHPDIEYSIVGGLFSGDWKGRAAMARAARELFSMWKDHRSVVDEIRPLDSERVLVLSHVSGRAKKSGIELDATQTRIAALWQVRDGKVIRHVVYLDRDRALADLGLASEGDSP
jgi:ketosteroid isomerase-like protein